MQPTRRSSTQPRHSHKPNNTPINPVIPWETFPKLTFSKAEVMQVYRYTQIQSSTVSASTPLAASPALPTQPPAARPLTQGSSSRRDSSGAGASGQVSARFACTEPGCKASFKRKEYMGRHVITVHEGKRNFSCPYPSCSKAFGKKSNVDTHYKVIHLKQKTNICPFCKKSFGKRYNLNIHITSRVCTSGNKSNK
jgi:Zinc finger, C2H2 type